MPFPSTAGGTPIARDQYVDQGEGIDVLQILGQGGGVKSGQSLTGIFYGSAMGTDNITAHSGGGQANAVPLVTGLNRVTTGATGDSVVLPPAIRGMEIVVANDIAGTSGNVINVFPASQAQGGATGGDQINGAGANVAFALGSSNDTVPIPVTIFYCFSNGAWRTK
jgi:hypothetical protein